MKDIAYYSSVSSYYGNLLLRKVEGISRVCGGHTLRVRFECHMAHNPKRRSVLELITSNHLTVRLEQVDSFYKNIARVDIARMEPTRILLSSMLLSTPEAVPFKLLNEHAYGSSREYSGLITWLGRIQSLNKGE
jgi:hypothetical protein